MRAMPEDIKRDFLPRIMKIKDKEARESILKMSSNYPERCQKLTNGSCVRAKRWSKDFGKEIKGRACIAELESILACEGV